MDTLEKKYESGRYLFREFERGDQAFRIEAGNVEIIRLDGDKIKVIAEVGAGAIIGEMSLISDKPRTASARALTSVTATVVSKNEYEKLLQKTDPLVRGVLRILAENVRDLHKPA